MAIQSTRCSRAESSMSKSRTRLIQGVRSDSAQWQWRSKMARRTTSSKGSRLAKARAEIDDDGRQDDQNRQKSRPTFRTSTSLLLDHHLSLLRIFFLLSFSSPVYVWPVRRRGWLSGRPLCRASWLPTFNTSASSSSHLVRRL